MSRYKTLAVVLIGLSAACATERNADTSVVIPVGALGSSPVPTLIEGRSNNREPADLMFLRLAELPPDLTTVGDDGVPLLAESWERRDSVTLVFHLDPRARWHDGVPVTAADVVFTFDRARDPDITPRLAPLLTTISDVVAEDEHTVIVRFERADPEQFYAATFHVQPLPAHLLEGMHPDSISTSFYLPAPVGNGPYRFGEMVPGQRMTLAANDDFFLGRPEVDRVVFLLSGDADARLNLLLGGEANAMRNIPTEGISRVQADPSLNAISTATFGVAYLLFNQRDPESFERPHPILADRRVRLAITHALDRETMLQAVFEEGAAVPHGPVSQLHWIRDANETGLPYDPDRARTLLRQAGWQESDGHLVRDGVTLTLSLNYPTSSRPRSQFAQLIQEQLRQVGITIELAGLEPPIWFQRRSAGDFDIDFSSATMDPSPSGIRQSWSCAGIGGSNVAHYCNPDVDILLDEAILATEDALPRWRAALTAIREDAPAAFIYSPPMVYGLHRRFQDVDFPAYGYWSHIWRWTVTDGSDTH